MLPAGAVLLGAEFALVAIGQDVVKCRRLEAGSSISDDVRERKAFLADDIRVLTPSLEPRGLIEALKEMAGPRTSGPASPLAGPDSKSWWLDAVLRSGLGLVARHHRWRSESGCNHLRLMHEHEVLSRIVELLGTHDGINLRQSEGVELALRRMQLMEEAVSESPSDPSFEGAEHFLGIQEKRGGALVAPSLRAHVAGELGREAAILREKRKAREAKGTSKGAKKE